jgi:hypothetical protein
MMQQGHTAGPAYIGAAALFRLRGRLWSLRSALDRVDALEYQAHYIFNFRNQVGVGRFTGGRRNIYRDRSDRANRGLHLLHFVAIMVPERALNHADASQHNLADALDVTEYCFQVEAHVISFDSMKRRYRVGPAPAGLRPVRE